ncbi:hypothetical protein O6H91_18G045500 [Diphasiastrum complanatum]|uniref:Uncharacterized protein n=1 Tax=Diphasiastrum complanatum TaxID=34168 RepID=A0ACC2B0K8_DIPCM|nr:hypothetical protein O6H91_18G045500 [Diphasiastrum complanatum]
MKNFLSDFACNVRSAIILAVSLVAALVIIDSYTWRLLSFPWTIPSSNIPPSFSKEISENTIASNNFSDLHARLVSPAEAEAAIAKAKAADGITDDDYSKFDGQGMQGIAPLPPSTEANSPRAQTVTGMPSPLSAEIPSPEYSEGLVSGTGEGSLQASHSNSLSQPPISQPPMSQPPTSNEMHSNTASIVENTSQTSKSSKDAQHSQTNLQKLESSLRRARMAIRRAVTGGGINAEPKLGSIDYEPVGELYRNAAIFRHYHEMETHFKIYVYQEGEEPLVHSGPCKDIYAIEGRFIQELQGRNPFLTSDPEKAHAFFLPFSVAHMVSYLYSDNSKDMSPLKRVVRDYIDVVNLKYPYWNRSGGADHFMLTCHDWGPHVSRAHQDLSTNVIRVLCNANVSEGYIPYKDASLPEINLIGGHIPTELGGPSGPERQFLAFFAGGDHGPVRPVLFEFWKEKDSDVRVFQSLPPGVSYQDYMKKSKFCLCPGGYEVNSPRIVEAIYNDCVPVIIADSFVLPFSDILDWSTFSIHVLEKDIPSLKIILESVSMEKYLRMQDRVRQVQRHFLLNQPPKRYDVFHMILHSVWLRRLNILIRDY